MIAANKTATKDIATGATALQNRSILRIAVSICAVFPPEITIVQSFSMAISLAVDDNLRRQPKVKIPLNNKLF